MNEARRLMLVHNIDARPAAAATDGYGFPPRRRDQGGAPTPAGAYLAGILGRRFLRERHLGALVRRRRGAHEGQVLELCGTRANLDVAAYVHGFLTDTAQRLWRGHKRASGIHSDRERRSFCAGVMAGFDEKLGEGSEQKRARNKGSSITRTRSGTPT